MRCVAPLLFLVACADLPPGVERVTITRGQSLLTAANGALYGADLSGLWRAEPTPGAERKVLVTNERVFDLSADSAEITFTQAPEDQPLVTIRRAGLDGSNVQDLAGNVHPGSLRRDTSNLYWIDRSGAVPEIWRTQKTGKPTRVTEVDSTSLSDLAVDNAYVFWIADNVIRRAPKGGGASTAFVTDVTPAQLATDGVVLFFVDLQEESHPLFSVLPTGEKTELVHDVSKFWLDDVHVYFTSYTNKKAIKQSLKRLHKETGVLQILVSDLNTVSLLQMAFDPTHFFWADGNDVRRMKKPD